MEKEISLALADALSEDGNWWLYIVETRHGHWYTGISTDVARRFKQHQDGSGAKNLKGKGPLTLILATPAGSRSSASRLEYQVKQLTKVQKRQWVSERQAAGQTQALSAGDL